MGRRWLPIALIPWLFLAGAASGAEVASENLAEALAAAAPQANASVLALAVRAAECARHQGLLDSFKHHAVIDYA